MDTARLIWTQVIWRQWRKEPKVPLVLLVILSLGVAVFLSIRLANRAAVTGFSLFTESISGDSDLIVRPKAGSFRDESLLSLRETMGSVPATIFPILDTTAATGPGAEAGVYRIIGTDFVALSNAVYLTDDESDSPIQGSGNGFAEMLGRSDRVFVSGKSGFKKDDKLTLYLEGDTRDVIVGGVLSQDPLRPDIPTNLLVLDLPGAQALTGNAGLLSRLEIRIPPGLNFEANLEKAKERLAEWGGESFVIETPSERKESTTQMSAAFRLNLTILSTLALVVGAYLILQAMEASVIKRRSEIAILRCLGVTPRQIRQAWMMESLALGIGGSILGVILGYVLAQGMVRAISATVNTIYYETTTRSAGFDFSEAGFALLFGIVISLLAGWLPAREAATVAPAHAVATGRRGGGLKILQKPLLGVVLTLLAIGCAMVPPLKNGAGDSIPVGGYASALLFLLGLSILAGCLFPWVARSLSFRSRDPRRTYAASQFRLPEGRHRLAAAGLLAAFGMSAAMGILVSSFEKTLTAWIGQMLKADVYVASAGAQSVVSENKIPEEAWQKMLSTPGVAGFDRLRIYSINFQGRDTWLGGSDYNNTGSHLQLIWVDPPKNGTPDALDERSEDGIYSGWMSESFSQRFNLKKNQEIEVPTPDGLKRVKALGIYADYGSERGTLLVSRQYTSEWFKDRAVNNMAIYLDPGVDDQKWLAEFGQAYPGIVARTNTTLRNDAIRLFKQTFSVTYALEAIAVIIAVAGLGLAMVGLLLERKDELSALKELGLTRKGIARAAMWEGIGLSLVGVVGGLILSLLLGWILVFVVNRQSFGWTLNYSIPWLTFLGLMVGLLSTGGIVAWVVGYRIANLASDFNED